MTDVAISVENLGKLYRIGQRERYKALRDTIADTMHAPLRRLSSFIRRSPSDDGQAPTVDDQYIWALKDISFELKGGEVLGIIGPNGAGKTTLLKILSRISEPTEGLARIRGRVGALLEVGTGFHPELTGRENLYLNGSILGMKRSEINRKFDEIVDFAGVEKFLDTPMKLYSSGMYMRLAFSVAAHLNPEILVVDEVLAVGDAEFQKKCLGKMGEVAGSGRTVLFVSHNMGAVTSLCQRAIWLEQGKVRKDSSTGETVASYLSSVRKRHTVSEGRYLLDSHPGRLKSFDQAVVIHDCQLLDESEQPALYFMSGCAARIRIGYRMRNRITNAPVTFVCAFRNNQAQRIAYCASDVVGSSLNGLRTEGAVECLIPKLAFAPGTYSIDIGCKVSNGWADFIYEAIEFDVVDGGFYPTRSLPPEGTGDFLLDYSWKRL